MKKAIFFWCALLPIAAAAQSYPTRFFTGKALNVVQVGGDSTRLDVSFNFLDETGRYDGGDVREGDVLYVSDGLNGLAFEIDSVLSPGFTSVTVRVNKQAGLPGIPSGSGLVSRGTPVYSFMPFTSGSFQENQVLTEDFVWRVDSLLQVVSGTTNLSFSGASSPVTLNSSTGDDVTVTAGAGIGLTATAGNLTVANTGDLSATNELQTLSVAANTTTLSNSGGSMTIAGAGINSVGTSGSTITVTGTEVDGSTTNELQNLSLTGQSLGISSGTGVTLPIVGVTAGTGISVSTSSGNATVTNTGDLSSTNEIQRLDTFAVVSGILRASLLNDGVPFSGVPLPVPDGSETKVNAGTAIGVSGTGTTGSPYVVTNTAPDQTVSITNGGGIGVSGTYPAFTLTATDPSTTNELQNLSLTGQSLGISSGTGVTLPIVGVTAGTGISVSTSSGNATVTNTGDLSSTNEIQRLDTFAVVSGILRASLLNDGVPFSGVPLPVPDGSETKVNAGTAIGVSGTGTTGSPYVVTNTAPDQTVSITNGGGIGVSGTYPAFTLTATDPSTTNELQNLSLSGQALGISSGTGVTLPIVGVTAGTGISVSTSSGNATVTNTGDTNATDDLTGSGTTNYVAKWTGGMALGNSAVYEDAGKIGIGTIAPSETLHLASGGIKLPSNSSALSAQTLFYTNKDVLKFGPDKEIEKATAKTLALSQQTNWTAGDYWDLVSIANIEFGSVRIVMESSGNAQGSFRQCLLPVPYANDVWQSYGIAVTNNVWLLCPEQNSFSRSWGDRFVDQFKLALKVNNGTVSFRLVAVSAGEIRGAPFDYGNAIISIKFYFTENASLSANPAVETTSGTGMTVPTTYIPLVFSAPAARSVFRNAVSIGDSYKDNAPPANGMIIQGDVGAGTDVPSQKLHVSGNARITGAIYDSNNDPGSAGQRLSSTVTGTDWVPALDGSGASGQVAYWDGTNTLAGNSNFRWDNTDMELGIGTVPTASLHIVKGSVSSWSPMTVQGDVSGNMISTVWNENNSGGGGNNLFDLTVGGVNGGDPAYRLRSNGESESWVMALDNDAGNQFVIGNESLPGQGNDFFTITATGNTGIMNNAPGNTLSVGGTGAIEFPNGTTAQRPSATVPLLRHNSTVNGIEVKSTSGHWTRITSAATPTVSAGAGAGTGATVTLLTSANDLFGTIDLTTGSSPTAGGTVLTLTFNQSFSSSPRVSVSLECRNDNCLTQRNNFRVSAVGSASFQIVAKGGTSLPASTSIQLDYQIHN